MGGCQSISVRSVAEISLLVSVTRLIRRLNCAFSTPVSFGTAEPGVLQRQNDRKGFGF